MEQFDVFLGHNSQDKPVVRELAKALQARGLNAWLDEEQLPPGRPWQEGLETAIQICNTAAILVGGNGLGPWEVPEMRACLEEFVNRQSPVIPVLLPGLCSKPELPLFLRRFTWVDLRDGLTEAGLDRLAWGITGKKPKVSQQSNMAPNHTGSGEKISATDNLKQALSSIGVDPSKFPSNQGDESESNGHRLKSKRLAKSDEESNQQAATPQSKTVVIQQIDARSSKDAIIIGNQYGDIIKK